MVKPYFFTFIPLYFVVLGIGFATITFPMPGSDPVPEWLVRQEAIKEHIFETIIFPARWSGGSALFVGAAIWAVILSIALAYIWRSVCARCKSNI